MVVLHELGFSPFEWSMSDRVSGAPMEFIIRLDCWGTVDAAKFAEAILQELKRQPLLQANATVGSTHRESYWRPASNCTPEIQWCEGNPDHSSGFPEDFAPIDLENEIGFRFYGWRFRVNDQPRTVMKFVYHHACCDGKGGLGFAEHTFHRYQCLLDEKNASRDDSLAIDEQKILNRNLPAVSNLSFFSRVWRAVVVRPQRAGNMLLSKPRLFAESTSMAGGDDAGIFTEPPKQCTTEFSEDETKRIGAYAKTLSTTTNTILAGELFHVLHGHLEGSSDPNNKRNLRILLPFSLRDERHLRMPAANCVSMAYMEVGEKFLRDNNPDNRVLVAELARQINFIRRWNLQYSWIESLDLYARFLPLVRFFKFGKKGRSRNMAPIATTVMTNLGSVFSGSELVDSQGELAVEGLVVKSVHVLPPCNGSTIVNFSINFYGNRLTLDAAYLPSLLAQETANGLLGEWRRRILDSVTAIAQL